MGELMNTKADEDKVWNLLVTNYEECEYHGLSMEELKEFLQDEWSRDFNGMFIGRDVDCIGRLGIFFYEDKAYVGYEDFEKQQWVCSFDLDACNRPDWDEYVRLTPDNTQEFSFLRCSIIPKSRAMQMVENYLASGRLEGLYLSGTDGKPVIASGGHP